MLRAQILKQFVFLLAAAVWPTPDDAVDPLFGLAGERVFPLGSVIVSVQPPESYVGVLAHPFVVIRPGVTRSDPDDPRRVDEARFSVTVIGRNTGDRFGQGALIGANRTSQAQSAGRGIEELEEVVTRFALGSATAPGVLVDSTHGVQGSVSVTGPARPLHASPELAAIEAEVVVTNATLGRTYHAPGGLIATPLGAGAVSLAWVNPPARPDTFQNVLRRALVSGGAVPASPGDGSGVLLAGLLATAVTDHPGVGVWSYALFTVYDEVNTPATTAQRHSLGATATATAT